MTRPRPLIAGNWKMNGLAVEGKALADAVAAGARGLPATGPEVLLCPPATLMIIVASAVKGTAIVTGGQDCSAQPPGAHTGDIAAVMLADLGCRYVILGHSERRSDHHETDGVVRAKAEAAHGAGLTALVCVGETLAERDAGRTLQVISQQVHGSIPKNSQASNLVIAYEPVWAIGTGRTASAAQVGEVHHLIRKQLADRVPDPKDVRILYGGSVKAGNAKELLAVANVDGALVGGASLKAEEFLQIVAAVPPP